MSTKPNTIWQKAADTIKRYTAPKWLTLLMGDVWEITYAIVLSVGRAYIQQLEAKIIEVAQDTSLSNQQKFDKVFDYARGFTMVKITDSALNLLLEALFSRLKANHAV